VSLFEKLKKWLLLKIFFDDPATCSHEWEVYSTALNDGCLELQCKKCAIAGTVDDPTKSEWKKAFSAPESPYLWNEMDRVKIGTARLV